MCRPSKIDGRCEIRLLYLLKTLILYISCMRITPRVCTSVLSLTLGAHAHSEGYSSCRVCMCVCVCVCMCVCMCVCVCDHLITATSHIGITQQRYQRVHSNRAIVLNFADFPKNASFKSYGVICLPRAAPAS